MNVSQVENNIENLMGSYTPETFIFDFLLAYGQPKASITRLQKGDYNLAKDGDEILWKKKVCFKKETTKDLHLAIDELKSDPKRNKHKPRFFIVTDFSKFLAIDSDNGDSLDIQFSDLAAHFDFFLPWAGMEKSQLQNENPADVKAAERMGRLYDLILENNKIESEEDRHALNIFFARLLFCFFAEDTDIFKPDIFTNSIASHTAQDGSDLQQYLERLFEVLSVESRDEFPNYLKDFPFVNGGLFSEHHPVPKFSAKSRKIVIECGALNWKAINPDIFGSMMQAVVHSDKRSGMGMHYTSVVNIMKVIEPLFLNDLYEDLEKAGENKKKLQSLLKRIYNLKIFDPACGSGNFLIIAFKELCKLEIEIFKKINSSGQRYFDFYKSEISLTQFYGIELDDFAHELAKLSLWLAEHQMNVAFKEVFGESRPTLPLQDGGNIVCDNAIKTDWTKVCPIQEGHEVFLLGNPPYIGGKLQNAQQKEDLESISTELGKCKNLDYIACWFIKASNFIQNTNASFAFVSTNSICQGEQVPLLWPHLIKKGLEISFAYKSFPWTNNAKGSAAIICVIVGLRNKSHSPKYLFQGETKRKVNNISPYLIEGSHIIVEKRTVPISTIPRILFGSMPRDGGHLVLSREDKDNLLKENPAADKFIKRYLGSKEFIRGEERYCLWILDRELSEAKAIAGVSKRLEGVREERLKSKAQSTRKFSSLPHRFVQISYKGEPSIIIPRVSSARRTYIPIGFLDSDTVISDLAFAIYKPEPWLFCILSSRLHMIWVQIVAGRLKNDFRYSAGFCYNTFPIPKLTTASKLELETLSFNILDIREQFSELTMSELYNPDTMPPSLREAHLQADLAVENCYRKTAFLSDEDRLNSLLKLYEAMLKK